MIRSLLIAFVLVLVSFSTIGCAGMPPEYAQALHENVLLQGENYRLLEDNENLQARNERLLSENKSLISENEGLCLDMAKAKENEAATSMQRFRSEGELAVWLQSQLNPPASIDAAEWWSNAIALQDAAAQDGYIISVSFWDYGDGTVSVWAEAILTNGLMYAWDPENDKLKPEASPI